MSSRHVGRQAAVVRRNTCTGVTAKIELAAPAGSGAVYRVFGGGVVNASQFWLQYNNAPTGATTTIRYNDGAAKTYMLPTPV